MRHALSLTMLIDLIFIMLLSVSGSVSGWLSELLYFVAFLLPFAVGILGVRSIERNENRDFISGLSGVLTPTKKQVRLTLPIVFPTVAVIFVISFLTSLLLTELGIENSTVENAPLALMLLEHAFIPALLEELLFRLVPLLLMARYSNSGAIVWSALAFSLIHCNLFQIPYAFAAGFVFMTVAVMTGGILPSILLHFINNTLSVVWIKYCSTDTSAAIFVGALLLLSLVSLPFIIKYRGEYKESLAKCFSEKPQVYPSILALLIPTLLVAVLNVL